MFDKDFIDKIARKIAWAHWKALNPKDVSPSEMHLWVDLGDRERDAYRAAARAVASM